MVKIGVVTSIKYQNIIFCIPGRAVKEIKDDQAMSRRCTVQVLKESKKKSFAPAVAAEVQKEDSTSAK